MVVQDGHTAGRAADFRDLFVIRIHAARRLIAAERQGWRTPAVETQNRCRTRLHRFEERMIDGHIRNAIANRDVVIQKAPALRIRKTHPD